MNTYSHLKIAISELTDIVNNSNHVKGKSYYIMSFLGRVSIILICQTKANITISNGIEFVDILV